MATTNHEEQLKRLDQISVSLFEIHAKTLVIKKNSDIPAIILNVDIPMDISTLSISAGVDEKLQLLAKNLEYQSKRLDSIIGASIQNKVSTKRPPFLSRIFCYA